MASDRWQQLAEFFETAISLPPEQRSTYLDQASGGDPALRRELEALLAGEGQASDVLRRVVGAGAREALDRLPGAPRLAGERIGPYEVTGELGRGGMGAVYLAVRADDAYRKTVAIKVVRRGLDDPDTQRRFLAERQILANLEHPGVARLLDGGTTADGLPYVVMEHVDGERLDAYCDRHALPVAGRLTLFLRVCDAVQYAHRNLVVHRDLKPSNILVTPEGVPKLLDFGIAKLLDAPAGAPATRTVVRLMTPEYASPEQVRGDVITTASDVYSLGVVLYELLVGQRPYRVDRVTPEALERVICEQVPEPPSVVASRAPEDVARARGVRSDRLRRELAGDLDTIVLMALRKEPARRYVSVEQLVEDIRRHLEGQPVRARGDTFRYRAGKFVRRHRAGVAATLALVALSAFYVVSIGSERDRARLEAARAEQVARFLTEIFQVAERGQSAGPDVTVRELLERGSRRIENELAGEPTMQATMLGALGRAYQGLGLFREANPVLERALALQRERAVDELEVARAEYDLGVLATDMGRYPAADSLLRSALARRRAALPADHPDMVRALGARAQVSAQRAQYEEAERLLREAVRAARTFRGAEQQELPAVLSSLGGVRHRRGDYSEGERLLREALLLRRELFGDDHPSVPATLNRLGDLALERAAFMTADSLLRDAVASARAILGDDHPVVASYMRDLGEARGEIGDWEEADSLLRGALERHRRVLEEGHPEIAADLIELAYLRYLMLRPEETERLAREALVYARRYYKDEHPQVVTALNVVALGLEEQGDLRNAAAHYREAVTLARRLFGDDHERVIIPQMNLGSVLFHLAELEEAERVLRPALATSSRVLGDEHRATYRGRYWLGVTYVFMRRFGEAEPLLRRHLAHHRREDSTSMRTADALLALSIVAAGTGRSDEAERLATEGRRLYAAAAPSDYWQLDLALAAEGKALSAQGRYAAAERLLVAAMRRSQARWPNGHIYRSWARAELVSLYQAWGKPDRAAAVPK